MKLLTVGIAVMLALGVSSTGFAAAQKNTRTKLADNSSSTIAPATNPVATPNNANNGGQTTSPASAQGQAPTTQPTQAEAQQGQSQPQTAPSQATNSQDKDDDSDKD
jgi:hypothetical protein